MASCLPNPYPNPSGAGKLLEAQQQPGLHLSISVAFPPNCAKSAKENEKHGINPKVAALRAL